MKDISIYYTKSKKNEIDNSMEELDSDKKPMNEEIFSIYYSTKYPSLSTTDDGMLDILFDVDKYKLRYNMLIAYDYYKDTKLKYNISRFLSGGIYNANNKMDSSVIFKQ